MHNRRLPGFNPAPLEFAVHSSVSKSFALPAQKSAGTPAPILCPHLKAKTVTMPSFIHWYNARQRDADLLLHELIGLLAK